MNSSDIRVRHQIPGTARRRYHGVGESIAIVTTEGRIFAMRILLTTTLLLALALHWLR